MRVRERHELVRRLEELEIAIVRAAQKSPRLLNPREENLLRTAVSLARMYKVRHEGRDVGVAAYLTPFREEVTRKLEPLFLSGKPPTRDRVLPLLPSLKARTVDVRAGLVRRFHTRLPEAVIDREIRHKELVLVSGGGGGTGYVYVGVMSLLDDYGLRPKLLVGTSMGAVLSLFRSRMTHFDQAEVVNIVRNLSWRKLFRFISGEHRYGLPAALQLYLRAGIGRYFNASADLRDAGVRLNELPIRTIVAVSGIRRGMLPHPLEFYEKLFALTPRSLLDPIRVTHKLQATMGALAELFTRPEIMVKLHLGLDPGTESFDALDAVGFSSALPGVIHYDVIREDRRMRSLLDGLFESRGIFRMVDGGLVDNVPAKAAWTAVHRGVIGTRNAFVLALNAFSPKLTTPLWLPLQRLAALNTDGNRPYAHLFRDFRKTLSPLEIVPSVGLLAQAIELGRRQLTEDAPFLTRMLAPLVPL